MALFSTAFMPPSIVVSQNLPHVVEDSSDPSLHSSLPSQTHLYGMHLPSSHWNSFLSHFETSRMKKNKEISKEEIQMNVKKEKNGYQPNLQDVITKAYSAMQKKTMIGG